MKSWGRFFVIFIAYALALLHTAIPHHHQTVHQGLVISSTTCCPPVSDGLLGRALSTDLGIGHLETFKAESHSELAQSSLTSTGTHAHERISSRVITAQLAYQPGHITSLKQRRLLFGTTSFRGPPQLA